MRWVPWFIGAAVLCACGGDEERGTAGIALDGTGFDDSGGDDDFGTSGGVVDEEGGSDDDDTDGEEPDPDAGDDDPDPDTGGEMFDCEPLWAPAWIGSPCGSDADCDYDGGTCITDTEGYPCGTCTLPCADLCPDSDGAPETFCVDGAAVGLDPGGHCLSQADAELPTTNGCRDGYVPTGMSRYMDPGATAAVCVPELYSDNPRTSCQQALMELGAVFTPVDHTPESPEGHPELLCEIDEPLLLHSPVGGVSLRYIESDNAGEVFIGCNAAMSIVGSAAVASDLGVTEILHIGTYNCRVIGNSSTISQHGLGNAIDIGGFVLDNGETITLIDDWEDGVANPVTQPGQVLKNFADQIWALGLWNVLFTPEHDAAHDNHFHADLLPGGNTYD